MKINSILFCLIIVIIYYACTVLYAFNNIPEVVIPSAGTDPFIFDVISDEILSRGVLLKGLPAYFYTPSYAYFYSLIKLLTNDPVVFYKIIIAIQTAIFLISVYVFYLLINLISSNKHGAAVSALLYAFYPLNLFYAVTPLKTILEVSLLVFYLYFLLSGIEKVSYKRIIAAALTLGFLITLRGSFLLFILIGGIAVFVKLDIQKALLFALIVFIPIAPLTARNFFVAKDFVLTYSASGIHSYIGNNTAAKPQYTTIPGVRGNSFGHFFDAKRIAEKSMGKQLKASEVNSYWNQQTQYFIFKHPRLFLKKLVHKFYVFLNNHEISNNYSIDYFKANYLPFKIFNLFIYGFGIVAATSASGFIFAGMKYRKLLVTKLFILVPITLMTFLTGRYRLPIAIFLLIGQSAFICSLFNKAFKFNKTYILAVVLILMISFNPLTSYKSVNMNNSQRKHEYSNNRKDIYTQQGKDAYIKKLTYDKIIFLKMFGLKPFQKTPTNKY